jgi:hypothetical protein
MEIFQTLSLKHPPNKGRFMSRIRTGNRRRLKKVLGAQGTHYFKATVEAIFPGGASCTAHQKIGIFSIPMPYWPVFNEDFRTFKPEVGMKFFMKMYPNGRIKTSLTSF